MPPGPGPSSPGRRASAGRRREARVHALPPNSGVESTQAAAGAGGRAGAKAGAGAGWNAGPGTGRKSAQNSRNSGRGCRGNLFGSRALLCALFRAVPPPVLTHIPLLFQCVGDARQSRKKSAQNSRNGIAPAREIARGNFLRTAPRRRTFGKIFPTTVLRTASAGPADWPDRRKKFSGDGVNATALQNLLRTAEHHPRVVAGRVLLCVLFLLFRRRDHPQFRCCFSVLGAHLHRGKNVLRTAGTAEVACPIRAASS